MWKRTAGSLLEPIVMQPEQASGVNDFTPTDAALYNAMQGGQGSALGQLYARHAGLVYSLALKVLNDTQEAEDLTQDIFLTLTRTAGYDPKRGSLRTYLAILTRSRAIDRVRSRNAASHVLNRFTSGKDQEIAANSPMDYISQEEQSQEVQAALAQLSEHQQEVLRKAYYEGLTQAKIAEQLNLPLGTVKTRARQALLKLRQVLEAHGGES